MRTRTKQKPAKDRYLELVQCVPLRPIRGEDELDEAINMVNYLIDQIDRRPLTTDEQDYLDVLSDLIEKYETEHIVFERSPDHRMLQFLIEAEGVTQAQVAKDCRIAESTISEVLTAKRRLNRKQIGKLAAYFHVAPTVFNFDS